MDNDEDYQRLGLTSLQADVITTILELGGEASAPQIIDDLGSKKKVNRTSIYSVLSKLEQMGLVVSKDSGRSSNYILVSTSPEKLIEKILEPQHKIVNEFTTKLQDAKNKDSRKIQFNLYQLQSKDQILNQVEMTIKQAKEYILIMATVSVLENIKQLIGEIKRKDQIKILVIPTWNPNPNLDMDKIIHEYRNLLSMENVSDPLPIFTKLVPIMQSLQTNLPPDLMQLTSETYFIMTLTETEMIMATYVGEILASGIFSREPMISFMLHIIYLNIYEQIVKFSDETKNPVIDILQAKTKMTMSSMLNQVND